MSERGGPEIDYLGDTIESEREARETARPKRPSARQALRQLAERKRAEAAKRTEEKSAQTKKAVVSVVVACGFGIASLACLVGSMAGRPASSPYAFVSSRAERDLGNVMELYAHDGDLDPEELIAFCRSRKRLNAAQRFYFMVLFDKPESARYPWSPFTGQAWHEDDHRRIRAIYCQNKTNGFSELRYHADNVYANFPTQVNP